MKRDKPISASLLAARLESGVQVSGWQNRRNCVQKRLSDVDQFLAGLQIGNLTI